jgi:hypothetical protein
MTVFALAGDDGWLSDSGPAYSQVDAVARFQHIGLPGEQFDGLLVELPSLAGAASASLVMPEKAAGAGGGPIAVAGAGGGPSAAAGAGGGPSAAATPLPLGTPAGNGMPLAAPDSATLFGNALGLLATLHQWIDMRYGDPHRPTRLSLGTAIPAGLNMVATWHGVTQAAGLHFADVCDFLVLHNLPRPTTDIGRAADTLLAAVGRLGKPAYLRFEFGLVDMPSPQLASFQGRDQLFFELALATVLHQLANEPGFAGVVLDDYANYQMLPERLEPEAGALRPGPRPSVNGAQPPPATGADNGAALPAVHPGQDQPR